MKFEEKQTYPWWGSMESQCKWVLPQGEGFLCCAWKEGHPADLPHETLHDQTEETVLANQHRWEYRPDLEIFSVPKSL